MTSTAAPHPESLGEQAVYQVAITFGHTRTDGSPLAPADIEAALSELKSDLNRICGGTCIQTHLGSYRCADGHDVDEVGSTIWAFGFGLDVPLSEFFSIATRLAWRLAQEAVMVAVERFPGSVFFITPDGFA